MKTREIIRTANGNLLRSKVRTGLTIVAIFIGAFTLSLTSALGAGVSSYIDSQLGNLGQEDTLIVTPKTDQGAPGEPRKYDPNQTTVRGAGGESNAVLTTEDIEALEGFENVVSVEPFVFVSPEFVRGPSGEKFTLALSTVNEETQVDLSSGALMAVGNAEYEIILPAGYVDALGFATDQTAVGQVVMIAVKDLNQNVYKVEARVAGVMESGLLGAGGAVANKSLRDELYRLQSTGLPPAATNVFAAALVKTKDAEQATLDRAKKDAEAAGYTAFTIDDQLGTIKTVISAITYVLNGFALLALLAAGFGIVNTLLMSVQERTREIGLMKAMGMSPRRIFALFSFEAALIGFWGSAMGVGIAWCTSLVVNSQLEGGLLADLPGLQLLLFTPGNVAFAMGLITVIALLSGTLPARRAAKLSPIDALRYE